MKKKHLKVGIGNINYNYLKMRNKGKSKISPGFYETSPVVMAYQLNPLRENNV